MHDSPTPPTVLITEHLDEAAARWLAERAHVVRVAPDDPEFDRRLAEAAALVVRTYTTVDDALLERAPALRVVGRAGTGLDNIDLDACRRRGVAVVHTPDANTQSVVEYVFAILFAVLRPLVPVRAAVDPAEWAGLRAPAAPRQLADCTLGIVGLGRIGGRVARAARGLGMPVLYHDPHLAAPATHIESRSAEALFAEADIITLHADGRPSNRDFVNDSLLSRMKDEVILVNTSRGMVVDAGALHDFLVSHPRALAVLDVHEPEPIAPDSLLLELPNARLLPHRASRTAPAMRAMSEVVRDVWAVLAGAPPRFAAVPPVSE